MVTHTKTVFFFPPCWSGKKYPSIYLCALLFVNQMAWWHFPVAFLHLWNFLMNVNSGGGSVSTFKRSNTWPEVVLGVGGRQRRLTFTISFRSHSGYREGFECTVSVVVRLQRFHCQGKKKKKYYYKKCRVTCDIVQLVQCCTLVVFYQFYLWQYLKRLFIFNRQKMKKH